MWRVALCLSITATTSHAAYTAAEAIQLATAVYNNNFDNTIIGDCDFNGADPATLCPRPMGNGCTMDQMFIGDPVDCKGTNMRFHEGESYQTLWRSIGMTLQANRQGKYEKVFDDDTGLRDRLPAEYQEGILEAGREALRKAKGIATTKGAKYGVGVCTTLAAAGQTAIADQMNLDKVKWAGTRIKFMREQYSKDGHEYLIIADSEDKNQVLVDYWYSAMDGNPVVGLVEELKGTGRWTLGNAKVATDKLGDRIYVIQAAGEEARYFRGDSYYGYDYVDDDAMLYDEAFENLREAQEQFELAKKLLRHSNDVQRFRTGQSNVRRKRHGRY